MGKWEMVKIPEVLFFQEGPGVRNTQYKSSGVKLLNVANLQDGKIDLSTSERYISEEEAYGRYQHFLVDDGDFIVASSGIKVEYIDKKMGFVKKEHLPLCMNTSTIRFKALDDKQLHIRYFMYCLKTTSFKKQLGKLITGSAQLNFGPSHLQKFTIPLPPLESQKQIAKTLDTAAELLALRKQQLTELDNLIKSTFYDMFHVYTIDKNYFRLLPDVCNFIDYRGKTPEKSNSGVPFITAKNVKNNVFSIEPQEYISADTYDVIMTRGFPKTNDVIFTTEAPLGNVCRIPNIFDKFAVGQRIIVMQPFENIVTSEYLEFALASDEFQTDMLKRSSGSTVRGIRSKELVQIYITVPPLYLQTQFAEIVTKIEEQKALVQQAINETQYLFDSLMSEYFD